jgi:hypothetical protein
MSIQLHNKITRLVEGNRQILTRFIHSMQVNSTPLEFDLPELQKIVVNIRMLHQRTRSAEEDTELLNELSVQLSKHNAWIMNCHEFVWMDGNGAINTREGEQMFAEHMLTALLSFIKHYLVSFVEAKSTKLLL